MAEQKDDSVQTAKPLQTRKSAAASAPAETGVERVAAEGATHAPSAGGLDERTPVSVVRRRQRYLVGLRVTPGFALTMRRDEAMRNDGGARNQRNQDAFLDRLQQMDGVDVIRHLPDLLVVSMDEQRGEALRRHAPPHIIVEADAPISHSDLAPSEPAGWQFRARSMPFPTLRREIRFCVQGEGERPLANATINLFGPGFPTQSTTDISGHAAVATFTRDAADIQGVYIRPAAGHWERYIPNPALDADRVNLVRLIPLDRSSPKAAVERQHGWGQRMMKFDRMSADWSGVGVKIGIIDSGCDVSHPILRHIERGVDLTRNHDSQSWQTDELGQ